MPNLTLKTYVSSATGLEGAMITDLEIRDPGEGAGPTLYATTGYSGTITAWDLTSTGPRQLNSSRHTRNDVPGTTACLAFVNTPGGPAVLTGGGSDGALVLRDLTATGSLGTQTNLGVLPSLAGDLLATVSVTLSSGAQVVYGGLAGASGVGQLNFSATGSLTGSATTPDTASTSANQVVALAEVKIGSQQYLFTASSVDVGVTCWAVSSTGALTARATLTSAQGLWIGTPTALDVTVVAGTTYLVLAAAGSNTLSVIAVAADGTMRVTDNVMDDLNSRFAGATAMTVVEHGGQSYVIVGGADDGISLYQILPGGRLLALAHLADTAAMGISDVSAIAAQSTATGIEIFVGSSSETGITQLNYDPGAAGQTLLAAAGGGTLTGGGNGDVLAGAAGVDRLSGGGGDDILMDGAGSDSMTGGSGADIFVLAADGVTDTITDFTLGTDKIDLSGWTSIGGLSQLTMVSTATGMTITYGTEVLVVTSSTGGAINPASLTEADLLNLTRIDVVIPQITPPPATPSSTPVDQVLQASRGGGFVYGGTGNDILTEGESGDWMLGEGGNDILIGGAGYDTLTGGDGADTFVVTASGNATFITDFTLYTDKIDLSGWVNLYAPSQLSITPTTTGFTIAYGSELVIVTSSAGGPIQRAWLTANDLVVSATPPDSGASGQALRAGASGGYLYGGSGDDTLTEAGGGDWLVGGYGDDILIGGAGYDTLTGGNGADTFVVTASGNATYITDFTLYTDKIDLSGWLNLYSVSQLSIQPISNGFVISYGSELLIVQSSAGGPIQQAWLTAGDLVVSATPPDSGTAGLAVQAGAGGGFLYGGSGDDILTEAGGGDWLVGDYGDDILISGGGYDTLTGGNGADTFVVTASGNATYITDFTLYVDTIDLSGWVNLYSVDQLYIESTSTGFVIAFGSELLIIESSAGGPIREAWLTASDVTVSTTPPSSGTPGQALLAGGSGGYLFGGSGNDQLTSGAGGDWLLGDYGNDALTAGAGYDTLTGGNGADTFIIKASGTTDVITDFTLGVDRIDLSGWSGLTSINQLYIESTSDGFLIAYGNELLVVTSSAGGPISPAWLTGSDLLSPYTPAPPSDLETGATAQATPGEDWLVGNAGSNMIDGLAGNDELTGQGGDDTLVGGDGRDWLTGGSGADLFVFRSTTESGVGWEARDVIDGFERGLDTIHLFTIDANTRVSGNQDFTFIGTASFGGLGSASAGQLRAVAVDANSVLVEMDVNGDGWADAQITVTGTTTLSASDFIL